MEVTFIAYQSVKQKEYCSEQKDDNHKNKFCAMQLDLSDDKEKAVSVDTLHDLLEKARIQLDDARKTETAGLHNFQMLK